MPHTEYNKYNGTIYNKVLHKLVFVILKTTKIDHFLNIGNKYYNSTIKFQQEKQQQRHDEKRVYCNIERVFVILRNITFIIYYYTIQRTEVIFYG